jgi:hypothetical protein
MAVSQRDLRVIAAHTARDLRGGLERARAQFDVQRPCEFTALRPPSRLECLVGGRRRASRCGKHRLAGRCQADRAGRALEQQHPELGLELLDDAAERLLRHVLTTRCSREVELLGDRDEVAQVLQLWQLILRPVATPSPEST